MENDKIKDAPRPHHYYFAHIYLRDRAREAAKQIVERFRGESGTRYLTSQWKKRWLAMKAETDEFISSDRLECFPIDLSSDYYGALVQLPKPERTAEAYFVAFILPADADYSTEADFYTLEYSKYRDTVEKTMLGQWVNKIHFNLGSGSAPEREAFVEALRQMMIKRSQKKKSSDKDKVGRIRI